MAVTIYDIANAAGVSIATVSKALNDSYSISAETKQRIRQTAEAMQYRPNARARSFARQKNGTVLFITDMYRNIAFENPHMFEIAVGVTDYLAKKGYSLTLHPLSAAEAPHVIRELMQEKTADGLILHAAVLSRELAAVLVRAEMPYLMIGKPNFPCALCWMDSNHELAGSLAANYLLDKGYRRIAFLMGGAETDKISQSRRAGILSALNEEGLPLKTSFGTGGYESGLLQAETLLSLEEPPDVLLCTNNYLALGCLQVISRRGLAIPSEIALMTFDDYPLSRLVEPKLTSVDVDMHDMGLEAARFILQKIRRPNLQTQSFCTAPTLIERAST